MTRRLLIATAAATLAAAIAASPAAALVAPGRVTVPFMSGQREGVDPFSVAGVAVMPDGRIVTSGIDAHAHLLLLTRVLSSGAPDPTFGGDGIVSLDVPHERGAYGPFPGTPQIASDGSVYVSSMGPSASRFEGQQLVVTHVLADGRPDPAFGTGGSAMPGIQMGAMALTSDGRILVAGDIGQFDSHNVNDALDTMTAVAARLTATGALDPTFGSGGVVKLPGNDATALAALPGGGAAVDTVENGTSRLNELAADGSVAAGFNGGAPLAVPGDIAGLLPRPGGAVDMLTTNARKAAGLLIRVRPDGTTDSSFGGGAVAVANGTLIPGPAGSDLVTTIGSIEPAPNQPFTMTVERVLADGTPDPLYGAAAGRTFSLPFGGGYGTIGAIHRLPQLGSLDQSGFRGGSVAARPGGGIVVAGAVGVIQYTGEGEGVEHEDVALTAFGSDLAPDPSFGGTAVAPKVSFSLPRQRARTAAAPRRRYVLARLTVSTPGLCQVSVRARGAVVAKSDVAVFATSGKNADVWLTKSGRKLLPHAHHATATARAVCEDLIGTRTTTTATGLLR